MCVSEPSRHELFEVDQMVVSRHLLSAVTVAVATAHVQAACERCGNGLLAEFGMEKGFVLSAQSFSLLVHFERVFVIIPRRYNLTESWQTTATGRALRVATRPGSERAIPCRLEPRLIARTCCVQHNSAQHNTTQHAEYSCSHTRARPHTPLQD